MRVAIVGSHRTGKSTLVSELAKRLPGYATVDEPYDLLEEDGHVFAHPPSVEDFEAQLDRSIGELADAPIDVLFDRCPVDVLAYLEVHEGRDLFDLDGWLPRVRTALDNLDLVVFVPVEMDDRIRFAATDDEGGWRTAVDGRLRDILLDDVLELGLEVLEVQGDVEDRTRIVLRKLGGEADLEVRGLVDE